MTRPLSLEALEGRRLLSVTVGDWYHGAAASGGSSTGTTAAPAASASSSVSSSGVRATPQRRAHHHRTIPPPSAPANLVATVVTGNAVTIQYNDTSTDETGFSVERSVNGGPFQKWTTLWAYKGAKHHTFNNILLKSGTTYAYRMRAVNGTLYSAYSNTVTVTTLVEAPPPPVVLPPVSNPPPPTTPGEVAKKILFIGNSFTMYNDVPGLVATIAQADGHPRPITAGELHLGWGLADHINQINTVEGSSAPIYSQVFDDVIFQDLTERATTSAGDVAGFRSDALKIIGMVKTHSPNVHVIGFETWARGPSNPVYPSIFTQPSQMESQLLAGYTLSRNDFNAQKSGSAEVSPAGEAFAALGWDRSLYDGDDEYHAGPKGSLLAALMLYKTTYHDNVSDIPAATVSGTLAALGLSAADWATLTAVVDSVPAVK